MLSVEPELNLKQLYEIDDHLWLETTIKLLKDKRLNQIDFEHLIEELESLSRKDKATVSRFLELIIIHLLLLQYWEQESKYNPNHWTVEILNFRHQLDDLLTTNLYNHLDSNLDIIYQRALKIVQLKTNHSLTLPLQCPYILQQLLDENWSP